ncbi:MAG: OmcA/MtrC family decaheme c-type cytochrome [Myxococcales bacterium]|nr:OmcA/MtrC family decaheme c-type cytochrome [Myxococcales bacterium]
MSATDQGRVLHHLTTKRTSSRKQEKRRLQGALVGALCVFLGLLWMQGCAGPQGPKGDTGAQGQPGTQGTQGDKGDKGDTGTPGTNGTNGTQGDKGDKGDTGTTGTTGKDGLPAAGAGIKLAITKVEINNDQKPVVSFTMTDTNGVRLRPTDLDSSSLRFTIAKILVDKASGRKRYENYHVEQVTGQPFTLNGQTMQPKMAQATQVPSTMDYMGTLTATEDGYSYVFERALPTDFDKNASHIVGMQATRESRAQVANTVFAFVPAGGTPDMPELLSGDSCNKCHSSMSAHGGQRNDIKLCVLCHTAQSTDPESGNSLDFFEMIHKLHAGADLPSVQKGTPYYFVGYRQSVHDFSKDRWPQDLRNCTTCHEDKHKAWKEIPSSQSCGSCHNDVNFQTGDGHLVGAKTDSECKTCHVPTGNEFDASVVGAHVLPTKAAQLPGVKFTLINVTNTKPGEKPVVEFSVTDKQGNSIDPANLSTLSLTLAGPTTGYLHHWTESVARTGSASKAVDLGGGKYSYTFTNAIPADAKGTYAIGVEGYKNENVKKPNGKFVQGADGNPLVVRDVGYNEIKLIAVTDTTPVAPKEVIDEAKCNTCHQQVQAHGGFRQNPQYCVMCHDANQTDAARRPSDKMPPASVHFKYMIHRIHSGAANASNPYVAYGYGGTAHDYSTIKYPMSLTKCESCHKPGTYTLPIADTRPATKVEQAGLVVSELPPVKSACSSCHTSIESQVHADLHTSTAKIETCVVCHGENRQFAVGRSHP